jgi:photosystem II stability/assembly factor-like uncharacterized protein
LSLFGGAGIGCGHANAQGHPAAGTSSAGELEPEARIARVDRLRLKALVRAGTRLVAAGERGRIVYSDDEAKSWNVAHTPTKMPITSLYFVDEKNGFATAHQGVLLRTRDAGASWSVVELELKEKAALFAMRLEQGRGYVVGAFGTVLETMDGGESWRQRRVGPDGFDRHLTGIASAGPKGLVLAGEAGALLRSTDSGATWKELKSPYEGSFFGILGLKGGALIAYGMRGNAFRSNDGGDTWQRIDLGGYKGSLQGGAQLADGTALLVGGDGMLAFSVDGGGFTTKTIADRRTVGAAERAANRWLTAGPTGLRWVD